MAKTYKQIMEEARQVVPEVSPDEVKGKLDGGTRPVLLDVREKEEFRQGYVPGAVSLPRGFLEMRVEEAVPDKGTRIVDMDTVDLSNLQRQILHTNDRIGMPKTESARLTLQALNPDVKVIEFRERLSSENAFRIFEPFDVIVNGCDNFPTRYLANDASVMLHKPLVDGAIWQFEGQATVFHPPEGPCYRCLFPEPPPPGAVPSCAEAGVLGVLPGIVGCVQALEAIKLILGKGRTLLGRMMHLDTLAGEVRILRLRRDPNCAVCSDHPRIRELIDYEMFCGLGGDSAAEGPAVASAATSSAAW